LVSLPSPAWCLCLRLLGVFIMFDACCTLTCLVPLPSPACVFTLTFCCYRV
jgi:hypothetical protein